MMNTRSPRARTTARRLGCGAILAVLAIVTQAGCGREFFRDWANQDVSEAVFEKTRDPRWRLDVFSVEPPALSRFADPYDQEVPPAPPDDLAAEALSPVPQWPDNRLLIPVEGTGYMELLDKWRRDADAIKEPFLSSDTAFQPSKPEAGPPRPPATPSPFTPSAGPGGNKPPTPPGAQPPASAPPATGSPMQSGPQSQNQASPPFNPRMYSGAQARYQAQPASGAQAEYQARSAKSTAKVVRLPEKPSTPPKSVQPPAVSQSPSGGPSRIGPQAQRDGRPIGVLALTPQTIVRLQDGPTIPTTPAVIEKPDITDRSNRNSGPNTTGSTPISVSKVNPSTANLRIPLPRQAATFGRVRRDETKDLKDKSVKQAAFQNTGTAAQPARNQRAGAPADQPKAVSPVEEQNKVSEFLDPQVPAPVLNLNQIEKAGEMNQQEAAELSGVLVPFVPLWPDERGYGYQPGSRPYKIDMQQAWVLALMNARFYQYNLETVYLAALPVTLQRFSFDPQFYAGMSPSTNVPQTNFSVTGAVSSGFPSTPGVVTSNTYTYGTRYSPNGAASTLNLGTVAGVGKLFSTGGQLVMGFANEVMFNFFGKNPNQPNVISALPISFVQPFLRGGGRAVTLEPLTQAERNLLYAVRSFILFRQQFFVATLTGGAVQNFGVGFSLPGFSSVGGDSDPVIGYLIVVFNLVEIEVDRRNLAFFENLVNLYSELIQGEASGLSQLQVDQVMQRLITARQALFNDEITYRLQLDEFKMQMGLPPDLPLIVDMGLAQPFYDVFNEVDRWQRRANRSLSELPTIISKIPELEDIDIEGRSALAPYRNYRSTLSMTKFQPETEEGLEELLETAVRIALEYRVDLMNFRAGLYDSWRQIRVTANALKGILNVAITNNVYAPVASPNPFDFLSQARQFSLAFNAELPLVRINERNNFRTALINYQRQRRSLQNSEDNLKVQIRNDLRQVHLAYVNYEIAKRNFELNVRLKDQAFEQIVAPPAGGTQSLAQSANAATQTTNLLGFQTALIGAQLALTNGWQAYQTNRLIFYRDIGILPYDEWEAFSELYPKQYHGPIIGHAPPGGRGFTAPPEARTATPESR